MVFAGKCGIEFESAIFKLIFQIDIWAKIGSGNGLVLSG